MTDPTNASGAAPSSRSIVTSPTSISDSHTAATDAES